jgi:hypothetical protein
MVLVTNTQLDLTCSRSKREDSRTSVVCIAAVPLGFGAKAAGFWRVTSCPPGMQSHTSWDGELKAQFVLRSICRLRVRFGSPQFVTHPNFMGQSPFRSLGWV